MSPHPSHPRRADLFERTDATPEAVDHMVALAREAVRIAIVHGGDPAAGVLRLAINELSPMPAPDPEADTGRALIAASVDERIVVTNAISALTRYARRQRLSAERDGLLAAKAVLLTWFKRATEAA